jgi:uncharacterized membrane protein SpoIIM required for sporulation
MRRDVFLLERQAAWDELRTLLARSNRRPESLGPDGVRRLGELYRSSAADLALARRCFTGDPIVAQLDELVGRARSVVYTRARRDGSVREFVTTRYWQRVRERPAYLLIAAALVLGVWALAGLWAWRNPGAALSVSPGAFRTWTEPHRAQPMPTAQQSAAFASELFTNNIRVSFLAFAAGIAAGLGAALVLLYNGLTVGVVTGLAVSAGNGRYLLEWIPAHGILEISCIVVAGAAGMRMGWALVAPGRRRRGDALAEEARAAVEIVLGTMPWLVLAGLLEGFVSPSGIGLAPRVAIGLSAAATYWALVIWRGRPVPDPTAVTGEPAPSL